MKQSSIKKNALLNIIYTITNIIFPLITYPYVARVLSSVGMGKVSFFTSVSSYAVMIGSLGISTYGIRVVAKARDNQKELNKVVSELFIINTVITIIVLALLAFSALFVDKFASEPILFIVNCIIILSTPLGLSWFFSGLEQYEYITKRTIAFKTISLILVFVLVKNKDDYPVYAALTAFSTVGAYVCNFIYSKRFAEIRIDSTLEYKKHFRPMLLLFASILAVSVYTNVDTIMLGFINGDREVGLYSVASKSKWLLLAAVNAVSAVLLPRLSNYLGNDKIEEYNRTLKKSVSFVFIVTIPLSIFFIIEAFDTVSILGGEDYKGAVICMQILMPILVISGFSNVTGNQVLIPQGKDSCFMKAVVVGAIMDIILNAILMPSIGCTGAAIATLAAEVTQMTIQFHYAKNDIFKNIQITTIFKAIIAGSIAGLLAFLIRKAFDYNMIVMMIIIGMVYFGVYIIALLIMKEQFVRELIIDVFSKHKHNLGNN